MSSWQLALPCIEAIATSVAAAFLIYPVLKKFLGRARPFDLEPSLADSCPPLDHYSCPSGHAMTATAFGMPVIILAPAAAAPVVIGGWLLVSWSRVALGHHYWSDIVAGTVIGGVIGAIASSLLA